MPRGEYSSLSDLGRAADSPFERSLQRTNEQVQQLTQNVNQLRPQVQQATQGMSQMISALEAGMERLRQEIAQVGANLQRVQTGGGGGGRRAAQQQIEQVETLAEIYRKMGVQLQGVKVDYDQLITSEKQLNKVHELSQDYDRKAINSYDQISAKYRIVKILYDNMSEDMLKRNPQIAADLRALYEQMNLLQQATGKYQLQVGDYSKAMTGLNIATVQIVREMPTLANSLSQFVIAISNNVPIWLDAIEKLNAQNKGIKDRVEAMRAEGAAAEEINAVLSKQVPVWKGLFRAMFSYQTVIIILLTVLPKLIKSIRDKRKAQQEDNKEVEKAITLHGLLAEAIAGIQDAIINAASDIGTLNGIMNDHTRTLEDQVSAWGAIQRLYPEIKANMEAQKEGYTDAATAVRTYIEWLEKEAEAKEILSKISDARLKRMEVENRMQEAQVRYEEEAANLRYAVQKNEEQAWKLYNARAYEEADRYFSEAQRARLRLKEYTDSFRQFNDAMDDSLKDEQLTEGALLIRLRAQAATFTDEITILTNELDATLMDTLGDEKGGRTKKVKEHTEKIEDYYFEMFDAILSGMDDSLQKSIAETELSWQKRDAELRAAMKEMQRITKEGNAQERAEAEKQLKYLNVIYLTEHENFLRERKQLISDMLASYSTEVEDETDTLRTDIERRLKLEKEWRDNQAYLRYENSKQDAEAKEALDTALRNSERQYWETYLQELRDNGELTVQLYNEIMAKLVKATKTATEEGEKQRGRRGRRYGGIAEALLAQTETYGEKNKYGMQVVKDQYSDFARSIDAALKESMKSMDDWMDKRLEMAKIAVESAQKEVDAAKTALEYELEARANGYANQVETARKELNLARQQKQRALEEQARFERAQQEIDTATQTSSLVTATANIWAAYTKAGFLGPALAAAATTAMWGSFVAAKVRAAQLAKMRTEQYGEGTVELLRGGSHASGHDIDLGTKPDGTRRRAEGGEYFAVINKRSSRKYGSLIPRVVTALNNGDFDEKYVRANTALADYALNMYGSSTDVSSLERDVHSILGQGMERRYTDGKGRTVVLYKNLTRRIN